MGSPDTSMADRVRALVAAHRGDRGALLPILHRIQEEFGYVDPDVVPVLARELNLSRADVHGVVTFYSDFRAEPAGRTTVRLCRAEACQSVGAERLVDHAEQALGIKLGQTTPDGSVTLEQVFCLGNCALGPAAQVNGRVLGRLDPGRLDAALGRAAAGGAVPIRAAAGGAVPSGAAASPAALRGAPSTTEAVNS